jgi:hypothetical protein
MDVEQYGTCDQGRGLGPLTAPGSGVSYPLLAWRSWLPSPGGLRGIVAGAIVASGMTVLATPPQSAPNQRTAILLPPRMLEPGDEPAIVRGAIDDLPGDVMGSTPVVRSGKAPASGPAWLTGVDPSVIPASGILPSRSSNNVRALGGASGTIAPANPESAANPSFPRLFDKSRHGALGPLTPGPEAPDPSAPLRGTATNGAPLMAGPPAYRWYGYGSVTPGANAYAPAGQYPRASSNWYSVTGATPGAFPVPVVSPYRAAPGSEPPNYVANPPPRSPATVPVMPTSNNASRVNFVPPPRYPAAANREPSALPPPDLGMSTSATPAVGVIGSMPSSVPLPPPQEPVGIPKIVAPPATPAAPPGGPTASFEPMAPTMPAAVAPAAAVPAIPPAEPPAPLAPAAPMAPLAPPTSEAPAVPMPPEAALPVAPPAIPVEPETKKPVEGLPVTVSKPADSAAPSSLPPSMTEVPSWKSMPGTPRTVPPGTWIPAAPPAPAIPPHDPGAESGANSAKPAAIIRGQMPDASRADPAAALIQAVCRGRAGGIDVRWTNSKKMAVCFEVRTEPEANQLVKEISARPELAPFAIDFCVLVK